MEGRLVVIRGNKKGEIFDIIPEKKLVVGRDSRCDFCLSGKLISRKHFSIFQDGDRFILNDLNSRNGVYVNEEKSYKRLLDDGDIIEIGEVSLRFDLDTVFTELPGDGSTEFFEEGNLKSTAIYKHKFDVENFGPAGMNDNSEEVNKEHSRLIMICNTF